jgi:hypothetical protein
MKNFKSAPGPGDFPAPDDDRGPEYRCHVCGIGLYRDEVEVDDIGGLYCSFCGTLIEIIEE